MPYAKRKYTKRTKGRKRLYRRRRGYRKTNSTLARPLYGAVNLSKSPLPEVFKTTLRYTDFDKLDVLLTNQADAHVIALNGMYDPDITFVGHQPRGFDQMMQLYNKYQVIGAKVTFEMLNTSTVPIQVGYAIMNTTVVGQYMSDYIEACTDVQYQSIGASGTSLDRYKGIAKFSPKKYFKRNNISDIDSLIASSSTNPSLPAFMHLWCASNGASANQLNTVFLTFTIEYIVLFREPKIVASS